MNTYIQRETERFSWNEYAETNPIPEGMQAIYDYLHEQHIKTARKIKMKQDEYKE